MDTNTQPISHSHCLPYRDCQPGTYLYSDGCTVRKHGDGTHTLIPYDSNPVAG